MSYCDILGVKVLEPQGKLTDEVKFEITFQCREKPKDDLEWKVVWVGSAKSEKHDQVLDEVEVPPEMGVNTFEFVVDGPDPAKIPSSDLIGVTVIMLQALYQGKEFVRIGYYVKTDYADEKMREEPPEVERPDPQLLERTILDEEPRVTRYLIEWDDIMPTAQVAEGAVASETNGFAPVMPQEGLMNSA
mmetsp:Transcript_13312/g.20883  ORF Transcript_13312/g.20883 Transcript_13312/m.20883 type:complete len:189 (-) Transcript_13312:258-824(-)|eukprot:CAMPEP_0184321292 /NCGR_PEP_ID=MMETSP1049-20130417/118137_1 /TAXON_ID=77928 /ORGANISM="Proteomonas sulcata, Strain CCMP704" /LENGTH=188 /DNA_ID=CAMNT_0026642027 /DNA_START=33 /DNA_END=599 /DNA_ORIENTATION=-